MRSLFFCVFRSLSDSVELVAPEDSHLCCQVYAVQRKDTNAIYAMKEMSRKKIKQERVPRLPVLEVDRS